MAKKRRLRNATPAMQRTQLGAYLKHARRELRLSVAKTAKLAGLSPADVKALEVDHTRSLNETELSKVANVLNLNTDVLLALMERIPKDIHDALVQKQKYPGNMGKIRKFLAALPACKTAAQQGMIIRRAGMLPARVMEPLEDDEK